MKLNLGCGKDIRDGWVNVDVYGDVFRWDLNIKPWPWEKDSVTEVMMNHVLEHLPDTQSVMRELYRVCKKDAVVRIAVPHPRHDDFLSDPTHVSVITPLMMQGFCKGANLETKNDANTPFALLNDVDFEITDQSYVVEKRWMERVESGQISQEQLLDAVLTFNNVVKQIELTLKVLK